MENYIIDVPPMEFESFDSMNSKQAQEFFDWYVGNTGKRVKTLFEYISKTGNNKIQADFRKQSLIDVWGWFECNITTEFMDFKEMLENIRGNKISFFKAISNPKKITSLTYAIAMDIAIYFAETFISNNNSVYWGFFTKPKNRMSVNKPVLLGFRNNMDLDPRLIVENGMWKSIEQKNEMYLFDVYEVWLKYV